MSESEQLIKNYQRIRWTHATTYEFMISFDQQYQPKDSTAGKINHTKPKMILTNLK